MTKLKRTWLKFEQLIIVNKHILWLALFIFFFFVFPYLVTENFDFDAISATIP